MNVPNKLEIYFLGRSLQPNLMVVTPEHTQVEHQTGVHIYFRLLAKCKLGWKGLSGTNALAYV